MGVSTVLQFEIIPYINGVLQRFDSLFEVQN